MTISSETVKQVFTGNGVTVTFAIPFSYTLSSEVKVYLRDEAVDPATETLKTIVTHYTISAGNVVMVTAPSSDEKLIIIRDTANAQSFDPLTSANLDADALESQLDKIVRMTQESQESLTRAPLFPKGAGVSGLGFPEPDADSFIKWNSAGTALENSSLGAITVVDLTVVDDLVIESVSGPAPLRVDSNEVVTTGPTSLATEVTGTLPIANGGTGAVTQTAAMDALSPTTTKGDLLVDNGTNVIRLAAGTDGYVLFADSGETAGVKWDVNLASTPLTTKGDLYTYDTDVQRLGVGADGEILSANSAEPTGLEWIPSPTGDVVGPVSSTDTAIARWSGTGGDTLQDSGVLVDASDNVSGVNDLGVGNDLSVVGTTTLDTGLTGFARLTAGVVSADTIDNADLTDAAAWSFKIRNAGTVGVVSDAALADFTAEVAPDAGDFVLGFLASGEIRKFDLDDLPFGSGGGGSSIVWRNDSGSAPLEETKYDNKCWNFEDGLTQYLYATVKVPQSYEAGVQIFMRLNHFHEAASASQLLSALTTLIEPGDAFDDTTDQHASTNAAVSAGNKVITEAVVDLTDSSGMINSVAVAAGDLLKIRLTRGTDTSVNDLFFIEGTTEVNFS